MTTTTKRKPALITKPYTRLYTATEITEHAHTLGLAITQRTDLNDREVSEVVDMLSKCGVDKIQAKVLLSATGRVDDGVDTSRTVNQCLHYLEILAGLKIHVMVAEAAASKKAATKRAGAAKKAKIKADKFRAKQAEL